MKKLLLVLLASAGVLVTGPVLAEDVYFDAPGVHVGVGERHHWRDHDWRWRHRHGFYAYGTGECRDVTVRHRRWDGTVVVRHIRRCD